MRRGVRVRLAFNDDTPGPDERPFEPPPPSTEPHVLEQLGAELKGIPGWHDLMHPRGLRPPTAVASRTALPPSYGPRRGRGLDRLDQRRVRIATPLLKGVLEMFSGKQSTPYAPGSLHDFMHAKVCVADDFVFVGSFNLSRSGETNAEN